MPPDALTSASMPPCARAQRLHGRVDLRAVGGVERERLGMRHSAGAAGDLPGEIEIDVGDRHRPAARHQRARNAFADRAAAAGEECEQAS